MPEEMAPVEGQVETPQGNYRQDEDGFAVSAGRAPDMTIQEAADADLSSPLDNPPWADPSLRLIGDDPEPEAEPEAESEPEKEPEGDPEQGVEGDPETEAPSALDPEQILEQELDAVVDGESAGKVKVRKLLADYQKLQAGDKRLQEAAAARKELEAEKEALQAFTAELDTNAGESLRKRFTAALGPQHGLNKLFQVADEIASYREKIQAMPEQERVNFFSQLDSQHYQGQIEAERQARVRAEQELKAAQDKAAQQQLIMEFGSEFQRANLNPQDAGDALVIDSITAKFLQAQASRNPISPREAVRSVMQQLQSREEAGIRRRVSEDPASFLEFLPEEARQVVERTLQAQRLQKTPLPTRAPASTKAAPKPRGRRTKEPYQPRSHLEAAELAELVDRGSYIDPQTGKPGVNWSD